MKRSRKRTFRRSAEARSLASARFRQRIVKNRKTYTRKGRRPTDSGLFDSGAQSGRNREADVTPRRRQAQGSDLWSRSV